MFHAPMRRFQLELIFYFTYFSTVVPSIVCFFSVGLSSLLWHFQQVLWVVKLLLSPNLDSWQLEFKSLIIVIVGFQNFVCCYVWAVYLGVQFTDEGRSLYIGSFYPAITSLSRFSEMSVATSMISSQDKMTQYTNFPLHQWFELLDKKPRPCNKQHFENKQLQ